MFFDDPFSSNSSISTSSVGSNINSFNDDASNDFIEFERFGDYEVESESSFGESTANTTNNTDVSVNPQQPLNHLMFISMLEHMCSLYANDEESSEILFKMVCEKLNSAMMIPNLSYLDEFKAVRVKYQTALKGLMEGSIATIKQDAIDNLKPETYSRFKSVATSAFTNNSWYKDMFTLEEHLATGGFGHVVKAKNKLDHKYYAIKKIPLLDTDIKKILQTLREVQIFSDLDHVNIVRYHSSWLEHNTDFCEKDIISKEESPRVSHKKNTASVNQLMKYEPSAGTFGFDLSTLQEESLLSKESARNNNQKDKQMLVWKSQAFTKTKLLKMTLYIQMELCNNTLRAWLHERNSNCKNTLEVDTCMNNNIFHQMLLAIDYIHGHGLMHRDIKPENVFLRYRKSELVIKVGDFGLARYHPTHMDPVTPTVDAPTTNFLFNFNPKEQTTGVGTTTYAAPEQLKNSSYTNKVDIWSLGIILFELYQPFTTEMERRVSIQNLLQHRVVAEEMTDLWKAESKLVIDMTEIEASERPCAQKALNIISKDDKQAIAQLQRQLRCQQKQIENLQKQLATQLCVKCKSLC